MSIIGSVGRAAFQAAFEISPILLKGGLAKEMGLDVAPLALLTQGISIPMSNEEFFAHWKPATGSTLMLNTVGNYPFANQSTAANAVIAQPLTVSMVMICPVNQSSSYATKAVKMNALIRAINLHIAKGGLFVVLTPAYIYDNCILTGIRDISAGETKQVQLMYSWDFTRPLIMTNNDAVGALSTLMDKIDKGVKLDSSAWSQSK